jgi:hypothetical protein
MDALLSRISVCYESLRNRNQSKILREQALKISHRSRNLIVIARFARYEAQRLKDVSKAAERVRVAQTSSCESPRPHSSRVNDQTNGER